MMHHVHLLKSFALFIVNAVINHHAYVLYFVVLRRFSLHHIIRNLKATSFKNLIH